MEGPTGEQGFKMRLGDYKIGQTIGCGSFATVRLAEHIPTGLKVAIKMYKRSKVKGMRMEDKVTREIKILRLLKHPCITHLYEVIETESKIYIIMEYLEHGELFDYLVRKGRLHEGEARFFFQQVVSGLLYCHMNMVIHRDLKLENLLLDSKYNVKIADFGLSNIMIDGHFLKTSCGSYAAPEVISGNSNVGPEVDVWGCGVALYTLLCGSLPFDDENTAILYKKIKAGEYTIPSHLSSEAKNLIQRMLEVEPLRRITIPEILCHPWFDPHHPHSIIVTSLHTTKRARKADFGFLVQASDFPFIHQNETKASVAWHHREKLVSESKWACGFETETPPSEILAKVSRAMQELNVDSKTIGPYNFRCRWYLESPHKSPLYMIKFEVQLYRTKERKYIIDVLRIQGPEFLFLDLCANLFTKLQVH
ncbi:SNF1-related protein kinase catalytic subunit alpha KIN10 isoform X1 [Amborella trichopoda]|uniref:SNF1-related protein kinase catalytic subunit alpha KIN10 isoform X1 n=1 Tax=Amborella trichopoda TaxID=13333 RepID=UPI0009C05FEA|nr:SNF1-related protein kinase catalytic subunit alpha KIN10 isoform X1 [Amborella trichopoda]XP_020522499.1 SNF1-related protein kinase catalytic subunit alpha KIN10 isoform X1 [Amborella trichopoda]|eukprot:XP_020522498.1 SNF1-related protein kinase catalytic subunit alpha KIN10 isoform X1 [Amborella trichopoda]